MLELELQKNFFESRIEKIELLIELTDDYNRLVELEHLLEETKLELINVNLQISEQLTTNNG